MLEEIVKDPGAEILSAIVFSPIFHAEKFELWINPTAKFPLSANAKAELIRLFGIGRIWNYRGNHWQPNPEK